MIRLRYISLFSGIEAASVAWEPLGWEPVAFSEIEPFPCAVLAERFPDVPNLGDVNEIDWSDYVGAVDLIVGGSPCQAFSVAGRRRGLMDERGRLMLQYVRAVREVRPRWLLWENVPGVLSQSGGDAFATLHRELAECGYSLAWRVLDAQFAGVAQRRRRVFLVGHSDPGRAAAVLFERESLRWDSPSSRDKRKELAAAAGRGSAGSCFGILGNVCDRRSTQNGSGVSEDVAPTLNMVDRHAVSYDGRAPGAAIAFSAGQSAKSGSVAAHAEVAPTLRAGSSGTNQVPTICFNHSASGSRGLGESVELSPTLRSSPGNCSNMPSVCMASGQANAETMEGCSPMLTRRGRKDSTVVTSGYCVRRLTPVECERLQGFPDGWTAIPWRGNPVEECPDTPRYKALGNSMAVPVMRWIGRRIQFVDGIEQ